MIKRLASLTFQDDVHLGLAPALSAAIDRAAQDGVLHGVVDEVSQRGLWCSLLTDDDAGDRAESFTLEQM